LGLDSPEALECYESMPPGTFSLKKLAECLDYKVAVGALRASVGIATNEEDLVRFEDPLRGFCA
jgi:hypothetical protein